MNIGNNIKSIREKLGITQQTLADKVNISRPMITQIERGTKQCGIPLGLDIAKALGCSIDDLIDGEKGAQ